MEIDLKKEKVMDKIERRLQFIIALSLFLPTISEEITKRLLQFLPSIDAGNFIWTIVSMTLLTYIFLQLTQESIRLKFLHIIEVSLLFETLLLVGMILAALINKGDELIGMNLFMFQVCSAFLPFALLVSFVVTLIGAIHGTVLFIKKKLKK